MKARKSASRGSGLAAWLEQTAPSWHDEWVFTVVREIPAYSGMEREQLHATVGRHIAALRGLWERGDAEPLQEFFSDLAQRRVSERVRLADVARAVAVGERLLLPRLAASRVRSRAAAARQVSETFERCRYLLLECYQSAGERAAEDARRLIRATEEGAAKTLQEWSLLDQVLSAMDVGIVLMDQDLRVVWVNRTVPPGILEVPREEATGRSCREVIRCEFRDCDQCSSLTAHEAVPSVQVVKKVGEGPEARDFLKLTRKLGAGERGTPQIMEIFLDITAQKEAQRSLARTQVFVKNILNSSASGIISTDLKGRITLFNRAAGHLFGYTEQEMLGQKVADYYGGGKEEAKRVMRRLSRDGVLADYETTFRLKSGQYIPVRVTASLIRDENETILGTMGFCQDLRTEEALKREVASRQQYLLTILQASMDGLVTLDAHNHIASWNRGASAIFGVEPESALGRHMMELLPLDGRRELPSSFKLPAGTKRFEATLRRPGGEAMDLLVTRTEIQDPSSGEMGASLVLKDVTELNKLQRDLAEAEHLAELGRLAASVAHEIKNPIAGLRGAMEMMRGVHLREDPRFAVFQEALLQMRRLDSLVKDLLSFAKPVNTSLEPIPLDLVVESTLPFVEGGAKEAQVSIRLDVPPDLPLVYADPQHLQQVLVNLIMNGIQAIEGGGEVTLTGRAAGRELSLEVRDTGAGIKPEDLKNIFRPFFTTKHIGTGLGLSIVQRIMRAHGGRIEVDSEVGRGTAFTVFLPVVAGSGTPASP